MSEPTNVDLVQELHKDLARKYQNHASKLDINWRSFNVSQRRDCLLAGGNGLALKDAWDDSLGNVHKVIPEWNLQDVAENGPDFFMDMLLYRATTSLVDQCFRGTQQFISDRDFIVRSMHVNGLRHCEEFDNCYTSFLGERYGQAYQVNEIDGSQDLVDVMITSQSWIPQATGELVLLRQVYLLQNLNIMIEDILNTGRAKVNRPGIAGEKTLISDKSRISKVTHQPNLLELANIALDQKEAQTDILETLNTEPSLITHEVNRCFFSRPEILPDEKGRRPALLTDRYISAAFFEAMLGTFKKIAIWDYMKGLLDLFGERQSDRIYRAKILQALSNSCHVEYERAREKFKRDFQSGTGSKYFHRLSSTPNDPSEIRIKMKTKPETMTRTNPQAHYLLQLSRSETTPEQAITWLQKLTDLQESHPEERDKLDDNEIDALSHIIIIVEFQRDIHSLLHMPPFSRTKENSFAVALRDLDARLGRLKRQVDLGDYVVPIDNLKEPTMAQKALNKVEAYCNGEVAGTMSHHFQVLVDESLRYLRIKCEELRQQDLEVQANQQAIFPAEEAITPLQGQKLSDSLKKDKTRRPREQDSLTSKTSDVGEFARLPLPCKFLVRRSTVEVFSSLFMRSGPRSSIRWDAFQAAMSDVGFACVAKYGSVYTFFPAPNLSLKRAFTTHRPHKSQIEGNAALRLSRRLTKVYGWDEQTFTAA